MSGQHAASVGNITKAVATPSNLDAAVTMRYRDIELQNTMELRAAAWEIAAPSETGSQRQCKKTFKKYDFEALFKRNFKTKIASAKIEKNCWQITLQYDLQCPAAKDNRITYAAAAPSNLDAAATMRFAASCGKLACIYAHGNRTWQQSCSHYTAICNQRFNKWIELRARAEHQGGTRKNTRFRARASSTTQVPGNIHAAITMRFASPRCRTPRENWLTSKRSKLQPRTHKVPFIAACSHFTQKNARFRALASSPLPWVTTSLRHHFPSSPLPLLTTSLRHHFP